MHHELAVGAEQTDAGARGDDQVFVAGDGEDSITSPGVRFAVRARRRVAARAARHDDRSPPKCAASAGQIEISNRSRSRPG